MPAYSTADTPYQHSGSGSAHQKLTHSVVASQSVSLQAATLTYVQHKPYYTNQSYLTHPTSPLLQWSDGSVITRQSLNNAIKWLARSVQLNDSNFSTHSFRIGAATAASAAGIPDCLIKTMGRWSSDAYQIYIRTPDSMLDAVWRSLANVT